MGTHMISKCSKLVKNEYKTRPDWLGRVIHLEIVQENKFNYTTKWYIHKPESILENEMHKIF